LIRQKNEWNRIEKTAKNDTIAKESKKRQANFPNETK